MEATSDKLSENVTEESTKLSEISEESQPPDIGQKPNGIPETEISVESEILIGETTFVDSLSNTENDVSVVSEDVITESSTLPEADQIVEVTDSPVVETICTQDVSVVEVVVPENAEGVQVEVSNNSEVSCEDIVETNLELSTSNENVRFETEVLVETNDNDSNEVEANENQTEVDTSNNILTDINQGIELSEVLRSSDVADNVENNNCSLAQEMFNKEELLDILEGKDVRDNDVQTKQNKKVNIENNKMLETKLALQQLSRLKTEKQNSHSTPKRIKIPKKVIVNKKKEENIVNELVKDWDDEDPIDEQQITDTTVQSVTNETNEKKPDQRCSVDSLSGEGHNTSINKTNDDGQPQRRLPRVIKKKVIFDPDNPDTFTKTKNLNRSKELENDQCQLKKAKSETAPTRANSKSPISKLQWKKPSSKNIKQNKRLSEVDRLLMDEGAVNMIYQLTPEAPKGRKNMRTKAEFIKKLQSSTPEGKEMKFRERKKECREEEAKKILGGKQRNSLSSSVKSPSVCEDFETHSADDSIIYRRHSSSSYSSTCMSPRRMSDVDTSTNVPQGNDIKSEPENKNKNRILDQSGLFINEPLGSKDTINKDDCLSIKKKLNSKLSLALNKRKRDNRPEKPPKKLPRLEDSFDPDFKGQAKLLESEEFTDQLKWLSVKFDYRVAEIIIHKKRPKYCIDALKELVQVLSYIDKSSEISVTLLTSSCGKLCSELDLSTIVHVDPIERTKAADDFLETVRSVLWAVADHRKLLFTGVWGACSGLALPLIGLSDVAVASEGAAFGPAAPAPGLAVFLGACRQLPLSLINDLMIFGRQISSFEALQNSLVSRVLCNAGFSNQLRAVVREVANEPIDTIILKKKMLKLLKPSETTFLSLLDAERTLMAQYWASDKGQEDIRVNHYD